LPLERATELFGRTNLKIDNEERKIPSCGHFYFWADNQCPFFSPFTFDNKADQYLIKELIQERDATGLYQPKQFCVGHNHGLGEIHVDGYKFVKSETDLTSAERVFIYSTVLTHRGVPSLSILWKPNFRVVISVVICFIGY
jgi:hypothetical protein